MTSKTKKRWLNVLLTDDNMHSQHVLLHGQTPYVQVVHFLDVLYATQRLDHAVIVGVLGRGLHQNVEYVFDNRRSCEDNKCRKYERANRIGYFILGL